MEHFLQIKILHRIVTVLLFGGLLGLAFHVQHSWRMDDAARVAHSFKRVRLIGWPLPGLSLLVLPVSGQWLIHLIGWPLGQSWLLFGTYPYLLGCTFWLVLVSRLAWAQHQAGVAEMVGVALGGQALREIKMGLVMALLGTANFITAAVPVVSKPL